MGELFLKILNMSIAASWLILAVVLLRLLLKKAPKWIICLLWMLVAVRLICPINFESNYSVVPDTEPISRQNLDTAFPEVEFETYADREQNRLEIQQPRSEDVAVMVSHTMNGTEIAAIGWLSGMTGLILYATFSYLRLRRKVRPSLPLRDNIRVCDEIETPFILGIFRPRIYIPSGTDETQFPHIVAHEKAHLKRRDHWWKPLGFLVLAIHWFNPLVWLAYVLLCRDIELACDEKVICELDHAESVSYSDALLACSISRRTILACPLAFGEVGVKERVKLVLNYKKPAFWVILVAIAVCIVIGICFLTNPTDVQTQLQPGKYQTDAVVYSTKLDGDSDVKIPTAVMIDADLRFQTYYTETHTGEALGKLELYTLTNDELEEYTAWKDGWRNYRIQTITDAYILRMADQYFFLVFQTENGDTLLGYGWEDVTERGQDYSDDTGLIYLVVLTCDPSSDASPSDTASPLPNLARYETDAVFQKSEFDHHLNFGGNTSLDFRVDLTEQNSSFVLYVENSGDDDISLAIDDYETFESIAFCQIPPGRHIILPGFAWLEDTYRFSFSGEHMTGTAGIILGTNRLTHPSDEAPEPGLSAAVLSAILEHNQDLYPGNGVGCASFVTFATEDGRPSDNDQLDTVTVYGMTLYTEYDYSGDAFSDNGGCHCATALTFAVGYDGVYTLTEYWIPRDGSYYVGDIREKFPEGVQEDALDTQKYIRMQTQECYRQAVEYGQIDTNRVVERLLETVCVSNEASYSPGQYHPVDATIDYRELIYYGEYTLQYCFNEFLQGDQTGLKGYVMASVCRDVLRSFGDLDLLSDVTDLNGQDWFDYVLTHDSDIVIPYLSNEQR